MQKGRKEDSKVGVEEREKGELQTSSLETEQKFFFVLGHSRFVEFKPQILKVKILLQKNISLSFGSSSSYPTNFRSPFFPSGLLSIGVP